MKSRPLRLSLGQDAHQGDDVAYLYAEDAGRRLAQDDAVPVAGIRRAAGHESAEVEAVRGRLRRTRSRDRGRREVHAIRRVGLDEEGGGFLPIAGDRGEAGGGEDRLDPGLLP